MSYPLNNALQRQIDPPKWRVNHFRKPHVNLDGRRFAVTRSLTPLCIGKIETPDRSTLSAGDDACAKNAGPAVVTPSIYPLRIYIDLEICSRVPRIFLAGR